MINYGIGQGEILVTPLQMAVYAASLANGGTVYQPHIVRAVNNNITKKIEYFDYAHKSVPVNNHFFDIVRGGMFDVVNEPGGTGHGAQIQGLNVCGKTGTAQNPHGQDHAWFICFAPLDHPKIAMCVMVENAGFGGTVSAPIARELISLYLKPDSTSKALNLQKNQQKPGQAGGGINPIKNAMNKR
jgi:penicillin-binding protein 2